MFVSAAAAVLVLVVTSGSCQDVPPKPSFPDVFQAQVEGVFIKQDGVVEMDASLYYDGEHNRAAYEFTMAGDTTRTTYDFETNEIVEFDGNQCQVNEIPDNPGETFFPFKTEGGKKKIEKPEVLLFFDKSEFDSQELILLPMLVYKANIDIPSYNQKNCEVMHFFSKKIELPKCKATDDCRPTLKSISVKCKDEKGEVVVDHAYSFFRFASEIEDEAVFKPPPGVFCAMKSARDFPAFNHYFTFSYDVVDVLKQDGGPDSVTSTHSEVWYAGDNKLLRIDDYDQRGVLVASRVYDLSSKKFFTIIPVVSKCFLADVNNVDLGTSTKLPKFLFYSDNTTSNDTVYVGKRIINELAFEVWSATWTDHLSDATIVEEVYFLQTVQEGKFGGPPMDPDLKISHLDIYTYQMNGETQSNELSMLRHLTINNYRTSPKDWAAFDVATCFNRNQKKEFYLKVNGSGIIRESKSYLQAVEGLYEKIVQETKASLMRFSELTGDFDGKKLIGIKGFIINNHKDSGFSPSEPNMDQLFSMIKSAADEGKLSATVDLGADEVATLTVLSVLDPDEILKASQKTCFSGGSMALASLVLLVVGISFGIAGYYVFLKKRKTGIHATLVKEMELANN